MSGNLAGPVLTFMFGAARYMNSGQTASPEHERPPPLPNAPASPWWTPHRHADRRPALLARSRIEAAVRAYFAREVFIMVDPTALQRSPGNETHLHAFGTEMIGNEGVGTAMYLHTSPEFSMKKLLAAGERRIASLGHVWRNRERSALHHPEFTMLEWYRASEPYDAVIADCLALLRKRFEQPDAGIARIGSRRCSPWILHASG